MGRSSGCPYVFTGCLVAGLPSGGGIMVEPSEIIFEVTEAVEGGYDARALGYSIFTQGDDWTDLNAMVKDAVTCHFGEQEVPKIILCS